MKEKWLNRIAVVGFVIVLGLWVWWLFRPQPMPFVLRARWKVKGFVIGSVAFSPKGDWLAAPVANFAHLAQGYQMPTVKLEVYLCRVTKTEATLKVLTISRKSYNHQLFDLEQPQIAFSPDGRFLAVVCFEQGMGKVVLFTVADGRRLRTITMGKNAWMLNVTFAPDGRLAVIRNSQLSFIRVNDGKKMPTNIQAEIIVFSPDGQWLAAIQPNGVSIYDANGHLVRQIQPPLYIFWTVVFSKDGQRFACLWSSQQGKSPRAPTRHGISVWRTKDWQLERSAPLTPFWPIAAFAPDLSLAALPEPDPSGWDGALWRLLNRLLRGNLLFAAPTQVVVRRLSDGKIIAKLPRFGYHVHGCAFSPDGRYLAVSHGNLIALWERKGD